MILSNATKKWFTSEMVSLLGFSEVGDIVEHIVSSIHTKDELDLYLSDLCGVPIARIDHISKRLFSISDLSQHARSKEPLVPPPLVANNRLKGSIKTSKKRVSNRIHSHKINCLRCGKIESNGGQRCVYCDAKLVYKKLDADTIKSIVSKLPEAPHKFESQGYKQISPPAQESLCAEIASALEKKLKKERMQFSTRSDMNSLIVTSDALSDI